MDFNVAQYECINFAARRYRQQKISRMNWK